ncbi:putative reverse transcriptase domain-containing protein [Tanacetum coccineum]
MCRVGSGQRGCDGLAVGTAGDNPRGALVGAAAARGAFGRLPNSRGVEYGSGQPGGKGLVEFYNGALNKVEYYNVALNKVKFYNGALNKVEYYNGALNKAGSLQAGSLVEEFYPRNAIEKLESESFREYTMMGIFMQGVGPCRLCYNCQKLGHFARDCRAPVRETVLALEGLTQPENTGGTMENHKLEERDFLGELQSMLLQGMDWLSKNKAEIVCHEKVRLGYIEVVDDTLMFKGNRTLGRLNNTVEHGRQRTCWDYHRNDKLSSARFNSGACRLRSPLSSSTLGMQELSEQL